MSVTPQALNIVREALAEARLKIVSKGVDPSQIGPAISALMRIQKETGKSIMDFNDNPADALSGLADDLVFSRVMKEVAKGKDDESDPKNDVFGNIFNPQFKKGN